MFNSFSPFFSHQTNIRSIKKNEKAEALSNGREAK